MRYGAIATAKTPNRHDDRAGQPDPPQLDAAEEQHDTDADRHEDRGAQVRLEHDQHRRDADVDAELLEVLVGAEPPALPLDGQRRGDEHARDLGELGRLELSEAERNPAPCAASHDAVART